MKHFKGITLCLLAICLLFAGCTNAVNYDLPPNPEGYETYEYQGFMAVDYNGRTYVPYGTLNGVLKSKHLDRCVGFVIQDGEELTEVRLFTLANDENNDFLMEYNVAGTMEQPMFLRAVDTIGCDIPQLDIIESLEYDYWEQYEF